MDVYGVLRTNVHAAHVTIKRVFLFNLKAKSKTNKFIFSFAIKVHVVCLVRNHTIRENP